MTFPTDKEHMVLDNMGLVRMVAGRMVRKYKGPMVEFDDLMQMGSLGLMRAVEKYDPSRGYAFSTFATYYIKGYMMRESDRVSGSVGASVHVMMLSRTIRARGQENEDPAELAKIYKYSVGTIKNAQYYAKMKVKSLDRKADPEGETDFYNLMFEEHDNDENLIATEFLATLKPQYQEIIRESMKGRMLTEIAADWGKCRQSVHAMRVRVQKKWERYERGLEKV